jgi:hypothetical protein
VEGKFVDSNSPWQLHPRAVTVICKGRNIFLKFAANSNKPVKACPRTITVRGRRFRRLLLSADTHLCGTITFACKSNWAGTIPLKGFYVNCEVAL